MTHDSVITVDEEIIGAELDGEFVMLDPASGNYFGLNAVGTTVWQFLRQQPRSLHEVVEHVCAQFDVSPDRCLAEVSALVETLAARQLVTVLNDGDSPVPHA